jgi:hypothetical protein
LRLCPACQVAVLDCAQVRSHWNAPPTPPRSAHAGYLRLSSSAKSLSSSPSTSIGSCGLTTTHFPV